MNKSVLIKKVFFKFFYIFSKLKTLICFLIDGRNKKFLLLCTPTHGNLGDQAIALAETDFLKKKNIPYFEVTAEDLDGLEYVYSRFSSKRQEILVHGGGFLGCLWPKEEYRFRSIIKNFPKKKIIVFPQTVTFDLTTETGSDFFYSSYEIYTKNKNIVFFLRDKNSFDFMKKNMQELNIYLVPDIVFTLNFEVNKALVRKDVIFLERKDIEKKIKQEESDFMIQSVKTVYSDSKIFYSDTCVNSIVFPFQRKKIVYKKLNEISKFELVLTDRLHGMIFAYITKTPCLVVNNKNGKIKATYEWIKSCENVKFCDKLDEINQNLAYLKTNENNFVHLIDFMNYFEPLVKVLMSRN